MSAGVAICYRPDARYRAKPGHDRCRDWGDQVAPKNIPEQIEIHTDRPREVFGGMGAGAMFYEALITSLAERGNSAQQEQFYDDMFSQVPTQFLQLMIRETHEPQNNNDDLSKPTFMNMTLGTPVTHCKLPKRP